MSTERENRLLSLSKKMFKDFTGVTLEYAKELIEIEQEMNASNSDKPKAEDEVIKVTNPGQPINIKTAPPPPTAKKQDDGDDLPF